VRIALDVTYSLGKNLSGVGVYSREMMSASPRAPAIVSFLLPPHRLLKSSLEAAGNASRRLLAEFSADLFTLSISRWTGGRAAPSHFHDLFVMTGSTRPRVRARFTDQARQATANSDAIIAVSQATATQVKPSSINHRAFMSCMVPGSPG
jgi:hypothetical protein